MVIMSHVARSRTRLRSALATFSTAAPGRPAFCRVVRQPFTCKVQQKRFRSVAASRDYATAAEALASTPNTRAALPAELSGELTEHLKVRGLIEAYRARGHYRAKVNPLSTQETSSIEDVLAAHGFTNADLDRTFTISADLLSQFRAVDTHTMTLRDIIAACESTYCSTYGVEIEHVEDPVQLQWLRERLEKPHPISLSREEKLDILGGLHWAGGFEQLLATKFPTAKRYGLDGVESLLPAVSSIIDRCVDEHGAEDIILGTCHRGRLTLAASVYGKHPEAVLAEFLGRPGWGLLPGSPGDVETHLGFEGKRVTPGGRTANLSVLANPSHLESIDPVAQGFARAAQDAIPEGEVEGRRRAVCVELHGDAAFTGQGVVYETLSMARLASYDVGGTIRMVVNNQIGFTADSAQSRSTHYSSDLAKLLGAPVFHVNSDDPEAVVFVCRLAADWRAAFGTDCVVDLICYRRYGHNELDQPRFTQPMQYKTIDAHPASDDIYAARLVAEGVATADELAARKQSVRDTLERHYDAAKTYECKVQRPYRAWDALPGLEQLRDTTLPAAQTSIARDVADRIAATMATPPPKFSPHKNIKRIVEGRWKSGYGKGVLDWTAAEALAMGSLVLEGHPVRMLGEDAQRGTFSQRHAVLHDQETGEKWTPLAELATAEQQQQEAGSFVIDNSPLSEYGALGFEYGYSLARPSALVVWEAQFGDFANGAQIVIDNFLAACEERWGDRSGLVLSLPHGHDGQGPEHSSARIERFAQMVGEDGRVWPGDLDRQHQDCNLQLVYPTTPANYFHVLRRQLRREFRKPLVIFFSKSLLRHPLNRSPIEDITSANSAFHPIITDPEHGKSIDAPELIRRHILCTGQVYAALHKHRQDNAIRDVAITRIEELSPFPFEEVKAAVEMYPASAGIVWAQEEHYNHGPWAHVRDRIETVLRRCDGDGALGSRALKYAGRGQSASTATGSREVHLAEEAELIKEAFTC